MIDIKFYDNQALEVMEQYKRQLIKKKINNNFVKKILKKMKIFI